MTQKNSKRIFVDKFPIYGRRKTIIFSRAKYHLIWLKQLCGYQRVVEENASFELGFQWKCVVNP